MRTTDKEIAELMAPRYEVIADYPNQKYKIGDILIVFDTVEQCERYIGSHIAVLNEAHHLEKYPTIFRPVPWHYKRELCDMPQYVRVNAREWMGVYRVDEWVQINTGTKMYFIAINRNSSARLFASDVVPTTEQEYINYINQKS